MNKLESYQVIPIIFFIYMVALSGSRWNAVYSISCAILWVILLWGILKTKQIIVQLPEKEFNLVYWPLPFILLLLFMV